MDDDSELLRQIANSGCRCWPRTFYRDRLTNEQAVSLVAAWLKNHDPSDEARLAPSPLANTLYVDQERENLQRDAEIRGKAEHQKAYRTYVTRADSKHFVVKDNNAATHLIRNALGGNNEDVLRGLL